MKSNRRSLRRWKTINKRNSRVKMFSESRMFSWNRPTISERREYIHKEQYVILETPCNCSCSQCSYKNSWWRKGDLKRMRDEGKKMVDNYFRFDYNDEEEYDGVDRLIG